MKEAKALWGSLSAHTTTRDDQKRFKTNGVRSMEGIKTVDDLVRAKGLTPAEEEQLRDIIEECRQREIKIQEASESTKRNMEALATNLGVIVQAITTIGKSIEELYDEAENMKLKMMPEHEFYRE
jgi:uncharacterized coiled-coil DUF342 family protein